MSKIICDVCGTSYPETATQCPICGFVHAADAASAGGEGAPKEYTHVKGGRFSKANVRKRNKANGGVSHEVYEEMYDDDDQQQAEEFVQERKSGKGLVVTAILLLLAIIAVVIYIVIRFFGPAFIPGTTPPETNASTETTLAVDERIACTGITLDVTRIDLETAGAARMLYATVEPSNTTDVLSFSSEDESIAKVTQNGKVTAVGKGETMITVSCGDIIVSCIVTCESPEAITDPTEDTTEATEDTTLPVVTEFSLNRKDITFDKKGSRWLIYDGSLPLNQITWTSDDEKVATIENGTVVAVGAGQTEVHAEYNGLKASCIIRCAFQDSSTDQGVGGNGGVTEDGGGAAGVTSCKIYSQYGPISYGGVAEASIAVGESLQLSLVDASGNTVTTAFSLSGSCCSASGNEITGVAGGTATITFNYGGQTYTCKIIVY